MGYASYSFLQVRAAPHAEGLHIQRERRAASKGKDNRYKREECSPQSSVNTVRSLAPHDVFLSYEI